MQLRIDSDQVKVTEIEPASPTSLRIDIRLDIRRTPRFVFRASRE